MRVVLFLFALAAAVLWNSGSVGRAQVMGEEAEMERLEARAEEAIANGDPDTASLSMGKAALMASQLAKTQNNLSRVKLYLGAERLFRAQEHAYRALALFERAGGRPPASSGVCSTIRMAQLNATESKDLFEEQDPGLREPGFLQEKGRLKTLAAEWLATVDELRTEFQCPK